MQNVVDIGIVRGEPDEPDHPTDVRDWPARQARALVPFDVRDGYPIHPGGLISPIGRNARRYGENACGDAAAVDIETLSVALIQRGDCGDWGFPGGHMDPGETPGRTIARELGEETCLRPSQDPVIIYQGLVEDEPRASAWAWYATSFGVYILHQRVPLIAANDAINADWFQIHHLDQDLATRGGQLYLPHRPLINHLHTWLDKRRSR